MRTRLIGSVLPLVVLGIVCVSVAAAAPVRSTVTIKVSSALGGKILVNSSGLTLYHYTGETKRKVACTGACAKLWPPLLASGGAKPVAGPGLVATKLGTIKRPDGGTQVTYNGLGLYRYSVDKKSGQTNGQGIAGAWFAVTSAGTITKAKVLAATPEATPNSSGSPTPATPATPATPGTPVMPNDCPPGVMNTQPASPCYNY